MRKKKKEQLERLKYLKGIWTCWIMHNNGKKNHFSSYNFVYVVR